MQTLVKPSVRQRIAISQDLPHWTLDDLSVDHVLLRLELKNLDFWQATVLKNLLISQIVAIKESIALESGHRGEEWARKAQIARNCKQASIGAIIAHLNDIKRSKEVKDSKCQDDRIIALEIENKRLQKKLSISRKHAENVERHRVAAYRVLLKRFGQEVMQGVYQEVEEQMCENNAT